MNQHASFSEMNRDGLLFLQADSLRGLVKHAFSTRLGGVSAPPYDALNLGKAGEDPRETILENYRRFCAAVGVTTDSLVFTNQVHGDTVRTVDASNCGEGLLRPAPEPCDALITNVPGVTLTVFSADCVPVLLVDPIRKVAGAVHAGWRGTASGIVKKTVEAMTACYGAKPCDLICAIGPSIGACCFETDPDVPEALRETLGASASPHVIPVSPGRFRIDLKAVNALWLSRCGVENVSISSECTVCRPERYFSHRRQGKRRGSMASVIQIIDNN